MRAISAPSRNTRYPAIPDSPSMEGDQTTSILSVPTAVAATPSGTVGGVRSGVVTVTPALGELSSPSSATAVTVYT